MRILLVDPAENMSIHTLSEVKEITGHRSYMPNLALPTLAALTPNDVEVRIVDETVEPIDFEECWDLVGITGYITDKRRMLQVADEFRSRKQLVAIGGPYATLSPETVRPHADILFIGEAEQTWPEFIADFRAGLWKKEYRASEPVDMRSSPPPAVGMLKQNAYFMGVVQTSRGCPFECEFCDVIVYLGRRQRHKSPERIVQELEQWYQAGYRNIFLSDDNFTAHRQRTRDIMLAVRDWNHCKSEKVLFGTQLSIDIARDRDLALLDLCAEAGLKMALIGIETPNPEALREVKKRQNLLGASLITDIQKIQSRGIIVEALMITGFDADTTDSFHVQYEFLQEAGTPLVALSMLSAPEGTPLEKRLITEDRLKVWPIEDFFLDTNIIPKRMTDQQLKEGTSWLWNKLYDPQAFLLRLARLAGHLPEAQQVYGRTRKGLLLWQRIRSTYQTLGPQFEQIPYEAGKLLRKKDLAILGPVLIFYLHIVRVLQKWGLWNPALALLDEPEFARIESPLEPVR